MTEIIQEFAEQNNLIAAVLDTSPMEYLLPALQECEISGFVHPNLQARLDPRKTMPDARSIIVIGMPCEAADLYEAPDGLSGSISWAAVGLDYHIRLKQLLSSLADVLLSHASFEYRIYSDTGPLNERALAYRGGLGFLGKNRFVISPEFGSSFFIGYILTDLQIKPMTRVVSGGCCECSRCISSCPGQALSSNGFNYKKCVSYLTQTRHVLSEAEMKSIGNRLYGCDICQDVCPHNHRRHNPRMVKLTSIVSMSNKEFMTSFGQSAAGWRGKSVFLRNAIIAAANTDIKSADAADIIHAGLQDKRYWIQSAAYWAKNQFYRFGLRG